MPDDKVRVLFVGEAPGPSGLSGWEGQSGKRLLKLMRAPPHQFVERMSAWRNLINRWPGRDPLRPGSAFPVTAKEFFRTKVERWLRHDFPKCRLIVLLGSRVARVTYGSPDYPDDRLWRLPAREKDGRIIVFVPHPSGCCRHWNDTRNVLHFRLIMSDLLAFALEDYGEDDGAA